MSGSTFLVKLRRRLRKKLAGILPIIIGAVALVGILYVLIHLIAPFLPEPYQRVLQQVQSGDFAAIQRSASQLFDGSGWGKPYVFVALQVLQVLFAPIPGQLMGLLGGYWFGFWYGLWLTMAGLGLASWIGIGVGRLLGEHMVRKIVPQSVLARFDYLVAEGGVWNFFMLFLLPALPDDTICFMAGLTRLRMWKLLLACLLGRLPGMAVLTYIGASLGGTMAFANVILAIAVIAAFVLWLFSDEVEAFFHRLSKGRARDTGE